MSDDEEFSGPPPGVYGNRRRVSVCAEPFNPNQIDDSPKVIHPKTDEQRSRLRGSFQHIFLFRSLDIEQTQEVMDAMFEKKVVKDEYVIVQGDDGDNFYVIDCGVYNIFVSIGTAEPKHVGNYDNKGSFGELALMYNTPRAATIQAVSDGVLWALDRTTFRRILLTAAFKKRQLYEEFLEAVPMLSSLERYEKMTLADALQAKQFSDGDCIIKQGDAADNFYIVEKGKVRVTVKASDDADEVYVTAVEKGGYFGELALVTHKPRAASVYAVGPVTCAFLDVGAFERLLGPCMDIMKRNFQNYEEQLVKLFGSSMNITDARN